MVELIKLNVLINAHGTLPCQKGVVFLII